MLRLDADENFNNAILRGVLRRVPEMDIVRIQDVGLTGADDPEVLSWAASEHRIVLSHDVTTLSMFGNIKLYLTATTNSATGYKPLTYASGFISLKEAGLRRLVHPPETTRYDKRGVRTGACQCRHPVDQSE